MEDFYGFLMWCSSNTWGFLNAQKPEFFISLSAIILTAWNMRQSMRHAGLSVIPAFSVWADYPRDDNHQCSIRFENKGFGPAILEDTLVFHKGEKIDGFQFERMERVLVQAFGDYLEQREQFATGGSGHAIGIGEEITFAAFSVSPKLTEQGAEAYGSRLRHISVTLKYRDIYNRLWVFIVRDLKGHTFRVNSVAFRFWHQFRFWNLLN